MAYTCVFDTDHEVHRAGLNMHLLTCQSKCVTGKQVAPPPSKQKAKWLQLKSEEEESQRWLEPEVQKSDPLDPDGLLQCPYDPNHHIRASRFPYHLLKCRKNHAELAAKLVTCPFNARHILPREDLSAHISGCEDRCSIHPDKGNEKPMYQKSLDLSRCSAPPCEEDWDKEMEQEKMSSVGGAAFSHGSCPVSLMDFASSLGSHLRAPKSMPYVLPWKLNNQA
ncbi:gametocyte-specific factor 1-like isoform X2 [Dendropsophus ebraccatus]